jgi:hypothetical protein
MISWRLGSAFASLAIVVLALIAGSVHFAFSYVQTRMLELGDLQSESRRVALEDARQVNAELLMGVGDLTLTGRATELMEAEFLYYTPPLHSAMTYTVTGEVGTLLLTYASPDVVPNFEQEAKFQSKSFVRLSNAVPVSLTVGMAVNEGHLRLAGLNLSELNIGMAMGDTEIDLRDDWQHSFAVDIGGGFGKTVVWLPVDTGVRVQLEDGDEAVSLRGLTQSGGFYVNDAYGKTPVTLDVLVGGGPGQVRLEVAR